MILRLAGMNFLHLAYFLEKNLVEHLNLWCLLRLKSEQMLKEKKILNLNKGACCMNDYTLSGICRGQACLTRGRGGLLEVIYLDTRSP